MLSQNNVNNLKKLNIYNNLLLAANGGHGLYVHNRKFYWNSLEKYFEPIYYDGEFNLTKKTRKLNYPLSLYYEISIDATLNLIKNLDHKKLLANINKRNLTLTNEQLRLKLDSLINNLIEIKKLYNEKENYDIKYNLIIYKDIKLFKNYVQNLEDQKIRYKFAKYHYEELTKKSYLKICEHGLEECDESLLLSNENKKILRGKLKIKNFDYQFIKNNKDKFINYRKTLLDDENFDKVLFVYNDNIEFEYDKKNKKFDIFQLNSNGRSFFFDGVIKDLNIKFNGKENQYIKKETVKYDQNNLTGCLSFIKINFEDTNLNSVYSNCEDGINLINTNGNLDNVYAKYSVLDAIDLDFSNLFIKNINIKNSGNDCVDFSYGKYKVDFFELANCGDKAISVGEKSKIEIKNIDIRKAVTGIASKDSSVVYVGKIKINETDDCYTAYRKKQEFDGGLLKINIAECQNFKRELFQDKFSKVEIINNL